MPGSKYWTRSFNPMTGCTPISPGCDHCWAEGMARRFKPCASCEENWRDECTACEPENYFTPTFHPDRLDAPLHWRKPQQVFVCNMGDLFHEAFTDEQIARVLCLTITAPQHTYLILTKRPERMRRFMRWHSEQLAKREYDWERTYPGRLEHIWPLPNLWLGVTVCNQAEADEKIPILLDTSAAVRWLSIEPMLGPVDIVRGYQWAKGAATDHYKAPIDWVVLGGETGAGARPMQPEWALDVYRQCRAAGVAFWFKGVGSALDWSADLKRLGPNFDEMILTRDMPAVRP